MWKFHNFPATQILREINSEDSRNSKTAFFAIFGALIFVNFVNSSQCAKIHKSKNSEPQKRKNGIF